MPKRRRDNRFPSDVLLNARRERRRERERERETLVSPRWLDIFGIGAPGRGHASLNNLMFLSTCTRTLAATAAALDTGVSPREHGQYPP